MSRSLRAATLMAGLIALAGIASAEQENFRPFPKELNEKAVADFKSFSRGKAGDSLKIEIFFQSGDKNTKLLADEAAKILKASGISITGPSTIMSEGSDLAPLVVQSNQGTVPMVDPFIRSLSCIIHAGDRVKTYSQNDIPDGVLQLFLIGTPRFEPDGRVILE